MSLGFRSLLRTTCSRPVGCTTREGDGADTTPPIVHHVETGTVRRISPKLPLLLHKYHYHYNHHLALTTYFPVTAMVDFAAVPRRLLLSLRLSLRLSDWVVLWLFVLLLLVVVVDAAVAANAMEAVAEVVFSFLAARDSCFSFSLFLRFLLSYSCQSPSIGCGRLRGKI